MCETKLSTIGLIVPDTFPTDLYETIHSQMANLNTEYPLQWRHYSGAWNAVGYRFISYAENDVDFTESVRRAGNAPIPEERYIQERALFLFFVNGLSSIESLLFGLFAIASIIKPDDFPLSTEQDLKRINPFFVRKKFKNLFPNHDIARQIDELLNNQEYKDFKKIRNILSHRAAYGREIFSGGDKNGEADWIENIQIDENTTSSRYPWVASSISNLMSGINSFLIQN